MGHMGHVAVGIVVVGLDDGLGAVRMERGAAEPIAVDRLAGFPHQAGLLIGIIPLPSAAVGLVDEAQKVADLVVDIPLGVGAAGMASLG